MCFPKELYDCDFKGIKIMLKILSGKNFSILISDKILTLV